LDNSVIVDGLMGSSAGRRVVVGFASARLLHSISFADVLDEETGQGYQRRFAEKHSIDFRRYIQMPGSSTIPLTFNLRPSLRAWTVETVGGGVVRVKVSTTEGPVLSQVDCQHRLGHIGDLNISLPFMIYLGLDITEELEVFNVINSKAKGLSGSLIDYHESRLTQNLGMERPELLIALHLNDAFESPWYKQLDLGGKATSGMKRRASLRTMQKAVKRFLAASVILDYYAPEYVASMITEFWKAVAQVLPDAWANPRKHFITKGIGVYALMGLLTDLVAEIRLVDLPPSKNTFAALLSDFAPAFDWSSHGPFRGLGGEAGAAEALAVLRTLRRSKRLIA